MKFPLWEVVQFTSARIVKHPVSDENGLAAMRPSSPMERCWCGLCRAAECDPGRMCQERA